MVDSKRQVGADRHQIRKAEKAFRAFLKDTSLKDRQQREHTYYGKSYGRNNAQLGWSHGPYTAAIKTVQRVCPQVSSKAIGRALMQSMISLFTRAAVREDASVDNEAESDSILDILNEQLPAAAVLEEVEALLSKLKEQVRQFTVFVPVAGVDLERLEIGAVTLCARARGPLDKAIEAVEGKGPSSREFIEHFFCGVRCYAFVDAEGEATFARQEGLNKVKDAICILNLYLVSCFSAASADELIAPVVRPPGSVSQPVFAITPPVEDGTVHPPLQHSLNARRLSTSLPRELHPGDEARWKRNGFDEIVRCFLADRDKDVKTFEGRVRQSVVWYSRGVASDQTDVQFVSLAIALETLLIGQSDSGPLVNWSSIGQKLADRVAYLLRAEVAERIKLAQEVKTLYGYRSGLVHAGVTVSGENLRRLDHIVSNTILAFATHHFESWKAFEKWERHQRYSVADATSDNVSEQPPTSQPPSQP